MAYFDTTWGAVARHRPPARLMAMEPENAERLAKAVLASLDSWIEQLETIEANANPGNKARSLHLLRSMGQAKHSLRHLIGETDP